MELRSSDIEQYLRLSKPERSAEDLNEQAAFLRANLETGDLQAADFRVARGPDEHVVAALRLIPMGGTSGMISRPVGDVDEAASLVDEVMVRATALGLAAVHARPRVEQCTPRYRDALLTAGFAQLGERVEYTVPIADLPGDNGSPLRWRTMDEAGSDLAVDMLARVARGDPFATEELEDPAASLRDTLTADELSSGPDCVHIGYRDDDPVALVIAQVGPEGWSRIAYMGLVPDARGQGLGTWVHRHGFAMMRAQGGTLYHGGTAVSNGAMVRLFEKHGCAVHARMLAFEWHR